MTSDTLTETVAKQAALCTENRRKHIVQMARNEYQEAGTIEIDNGAELSEPAAETNVDNGCYVQAWVWVSFAGTPYDTDEE